MRRVAYAMAAVFLLVAGCTKSDTVEATGKVTLDGQPAENAEVLFTPEGTGRMASGHTDASGQFNVDGGLVPGDYAVTLSEYYPPDKPPAMPQGGGMLPSRFPVKYADPATSPLKAHVEAGKKNEFQFDAKK